MHPSECCGISPDIVVYNNAQEPIMAIRCINGDREMMYKWAAQAVNESDSLKPAFLLLVNRDESCLIPRGDGALSMQWPEISQVASLMLSGKAEYERLKQVIHQILLETVADTRKRPSYNFPDISGCTVIVQD